MKPPVFSCLSSRVLNNGSLYGRFLFGPLPIDISLTIATILRRSLLHTQANLSIISAEIEGATHEYASLPGIQESVLEILLNLGEIVLARKKQNLVSWTKNFPSSVSFFGNRVQPHQSPLTALLQISGPCVVKAKDINWPKGVWCVKPNMPIATLSNNQTLAMRLKIMPISKQNSSNSFDVAENSDNFSTSSNESGPFRTENSSRELKPKESTWPGLMASSSAKRSSEAQSEWSFGPRPLLVPLAPRPRPTPKNTALVNTSVPISFRASDALVQRTTSQAPSSQPVWRQVVPKVSIKKAEDFINRKGITSTMLLEDREQQSVTLRRPLSKWNKEGFLLKQAKEVETLINSKKYLSEFQTALPRQLNFAKKNETKFDESSISSFSKPSFEPKHFSNKILGKELTSKSSKYIEDNNKVKCIELVVSSSIYPVEKVNFLIERDDQLAGYRHRIIFEVWTNGSISPRQAIFDSIGWILKLLYNFRQPSI